MRVSTLAYCRPQIPEGKVLENPWGWTQSRVEEEMAEGAQRCQESFMGEVSRGQCSPGVLLYSSASWLIQVQWLSTWQACCLGRIPFFCIPSVFGGNLIFLSQM